MLKELRQIPQEPGKGHRRWFMDENGLELIVWYDEEKTISGFQICYPNHYRQYAFTWKHDGRVIHNEVDTGSAPPFGMVGAKGTPVLKPDGIMPLDMVKKLFDDGATNLEVEISGLVDDILSRYDPVANKLN